MAAESLFALLVAAAAGGAFGAAVGALPAFAFTGVLVIAGEVIAIARESLAATAGTALGSVDVTGAIAFGPVFGPHVAFGGGAAAVAYAAKRGYLDTGFDYHEAKQVTRGLGSRPDVLAVGGAFGVLGHWIATLAGAAGLTERGVPYREVPERVALVEAARAVVDGCDCGRVVTPDPDDPVAFGDARAPARPAVFFGDLLLASPVDPVE